MYVYVHVLSIALKQITLKFRSLKPKTFIFLYSFLGSGIYELGCPGSGLLMRSQLNC